MGHGDVVVAGLLLLFGCCSLIVVVVAAAEYHDTLRTINLVGGCYHCKCHWLVMFVWSDLLLHNRTNGGRRRRQDGASRRL